MKRTLRAPGRPSGFAPRGKATAQTRQIYLQLAVHSFAVYLRVGAH